jgi:chromosome segregation ATPase
MSDDEEVALLEEQLNEARAEIERLQMAAADSEARASHLEELTGELRTRLEVAQGELATERQRCEEVGGQLAGAQTDLAAAQQETQELHARLQAAAGKYREALLAAAPDLPEDMVTGNSIEEIDASAEQARGAVRRVRDRLESQAQAGRVPAGSPPRGSPDFSALSPIEKIRLGLAQKP